MTTTMTTYTKDEVLAHRRELIDALRSGEYPQARRALVMVSSTGEPTGYCCLGVCETLAGTDYYDASDHASMRWFRHSDGSGEARFLTGYGQRWLGVTERNPRIALDYTPNGVNSRTMSELNDAGWSFDDIADALETYGFEEADDAYSE